MHKEPDIIFITGVGRSGTTLIQSMLHAHSQIHFSPETHFFKRFILPALLKKKSITKEQIAGDKYFMRLDRDLREKLLNQPTDKLEDLGGMFKNIMRGSLSALAYMGDKDTEYVRYIPHLARLFPKAFVICINRNPRDVIASRLKSDWGKSSSFAFHVAEYQYYIKKVLDDGKQYFNDRFITIKYEDLIEKPEKELKVICNRLNINFQKQMLEYYKNVATLVSEDEKQWKGNVSKPVQKNNQGKWRDQLNDHQAISIQKGIESYFEQNDYKILKGGRKSLLESMKISFFKKLFAMKTLKERIK